MKKVSGQSPKTKTPHKPALLPGARPAPRPSPAEFQKLGKGLRDACPRESHATWKPGSHRPDPLDLLAQSNKGRIANLIPIRMGRMVRTPFTFYRGAALGMAADLSTTPASGIRVQACGDCHLMNFGAFATPERKVIFDVNDMDETLPAPWEWDVKRLAASVVVACRNNGFTESAARDATLACVRSYREHMAEYSRMSVLEVWYSSVEVKKTLSTISDDQARRRFEKRFEAVRQRTVLDHDFPKLAAMAGEAPRIKDNPPLVYHPTPEGGESLIDRTWNGLATYRDSLQEDRRTLVDRYQIKDVAVKVVGVGSVGTFCGILLMMASEDDPLFLQIKEARPSVLEAYAGKSQYANHGQRIVNGYRLIQSASDIFLGWTQGELGRHFYVRQLRDMKISALVDLFTPSVMSDYAAACGWTLARAHARSGAPAHISGYLGKSDTFDKAIAKFAAAYADQNERDHEVLRKAVLDGQIEVVIEPE
ncbi:DUF2252 domain-containing protein [Variovorax sp. J22R133]|uniref:DUF2252 domain-containing protein n=1 Tax=Variovorax brevis TaxID=3053503 RepID=UPI002578F62F|nr:DUF2252 domain-containing protein [Variovorax sp. J22R133]MDM0113121.1 DUF2252 domain-containing protein [Variovorax sp. J22R133]